MTEDEAKTKWCQESFRQNPYLSGAAGGGGVGPTRCIGSECMAWRWAVANPKTGEVWPQASRQAVEFTMSRAEEGSLAGYCGLAGRPA